LCPFLSFSYKFELVCESSHSIRRTRHDIDLQERKGYEVKLRHPIACKTLRGADMSVCSGICDFVATGVERWKIIPGRASSAQLLPSPFPRVDQHT
jgi:hypothetical protein